MELRNLHLSMGRMKVALQVIGTGFGRTGTMSMKMALEQLGFGPCHHMDEVFRNPNQGANWMAALEGGPVDWDAIYQGYRSTVDWPSAAFWREAIQAYPEAKVILTVRPPEKWWASISETILNFIERVEESDSPELRKMLALPCEVVRRDLGELTEKAALAAFERRQREVRETVPADNLLVFDVTQGWEPLCDFLGCEIPEGSFPRSNSRQEFWANFDPDLMSEVAGAQPRAEA